METLNIEIVNPKAINLLREMEDLDLIKVIKNVNVLRPKASKILRGSISKESADEFNEYVKKSRNEWERNF